MRENFEKLSKSEKAVLITKVKKYKKFLDKHDDYLTLMSWIYFVIILLNVFSSINIMNRLTRITFKYRDKLKFLVSFSMLVFLGEFDEMALYEELKELTGERLYFVETPTFNIICIILVLIIVHLSNKYLLPIHIYEIFEPYAGVKDFMNFIEVKEYKYIYYLLTYYTAFWCIYRNIVRCLRFKLFQEMKMEK